MTRHRLPASPTSLASVPGKIQLWGYRELCTELLPGGLLLLSGPGNARTLPCVSLEYTPIHASKPACFSFQIPPVIHDSFLQPHEVQDILSRPPPRRDGGNDGGRLLSNISGIHVVRKELTWAFFRRASRQTYRIPSEPENGITTNSLAPEVIYQTLEDTYATILTDLSVCDILSSSL